MFIIYTYEILIYKWLEETNEFCKGFSKRNLLRIRKFYICFPIATPVASQFSWSHYLEILKIDKETKKIKVKKTIIVYIECE